MLEVFGIMWLCRLNGRNADVRGRSAGWAKAYTVILWVSMEIGGAIAGVVWLIAADIDASNLIYVFALMGAGLGALTSWLIAKRGTPVKEAYGDLSAQETAFFQQSQPLAAPCQVVVIREKSFAGMAASFRIDLNGQTVGHVGNDKSITFPTSSQFNVITGADAFGMRFGTSVNFEATAGGRVEVYMKGARFLPKRTQVIAGQPPAAPAPQPQPQPPQGDMVAKCPRCGTPGTPPSVVCPACGEGLQWYPASE